MSFTITLSSYDGSAVRQANDEMYQLLKTLGIENVTENFNMLAGNFEQKSLSFEMNTYYASSLFMFADKIAKNYKVRLQIDYWRLEE